MILAVALLPAFAIAQPTPAPSPEQQALGATVMACVTESVSLRTQIFILQAENERLNSAAKAAAPAVEPPSLPK